MSQEHHPKTLGLRYDTMVSFGGHVNEVQKKLSKRKNALRGLSGTDWGQGKETLLLTYRAVGRSCMDYAATAWSSLVKPTNRKKLQVVQNTALSIATGSLCLSSVEYLHNECKLLTTNNHHHLLNSRYCVYNIRAEIHTEGKQSYVLKRMASV